MSGFSLLNAAFLLGIAAAAVPVVIHLIHKRRARALDFPSLMFLHLVDLRLAGRKKLRELVVLALRTAAIALFAFGLSKPILRTRAAGEGGEPKKTSTTAVIVIDNSYSMGFKESGVTRLERAKDKSLEVLKTLAPGNSASVIAVCGHTPSDALLSRDLRGLQKRVEQLKIGPSAGSLEGALDIAARALESSTEINKELYIISDYQELLWAPVLAGEMLQNLSGSLVLVDVAQEPGANLALTSVQMAPSPAQAGMIEIGAKVRNYSSQSMTARLALVLEGKTRSEYPVTVPPGSEAAVSFLQNDAGNLRGHVFLKTDGLAMDNKRFFAFCADDSPGVLVVNGAPSDIWDFDETFYLVCAIAPGTRGQGFGGAGQRPAAKQAVEPRVITARELPKARLADYSAVVLANIGRLNRPAADLLADYVREGGGLIIFCGDQVKPELYNKMFRDKSSSRLLPCTLIGPRDYEEGLDVLSLVPLDWEHSIFSALKDIREDGFSTTYFSRVMVCEEDRGDRSVSVLARFSNGSPALLERKVGAGCVLFFAATCDRDWTNMPLRPVYLPLVHQMLSYIAGRRQHASSYLVGETVKYAFGPGLKKLALTVTDPAGGVTEAKVVAQPLLSEVLAAPGGALTASFDNTLDPGIYSAEVVTASGREVRHFAVNVDVRESDLARLTQAQVADALGGKALQLRSQDELASAISSMRTGVKLWDYFFYLALLALLAEGWLANRFVPGSAPSGASPGERKETAMATERISVN